MKEMSYQINFSMPTSGPPPDKKFSWGGDVNNLRDWLEGKNRKTQGPPRDQMCRWHGDPRVLRNWLGEGRTTNETKFDSGKLLINEPMMQMLPYYTEQYMAAKAEVKKLEEEIKWVDEEQDKWLANRNLYDVLYPHRSIAEYFDELDEQRYVARENRKAKLQEIRNWDVVRHAAAIMQKRNQRGGS